MTRRALRLGVLAAALSGCAEADPCAGKRDLVNSPAGLTLVAGEHPGWGSRECFQCHQRWEIHSADCVDEVAVGEIDATEPEECVACHGSNGVAEWADTGDAP